MKVNLLAAVVAVSAFAAMSTMGASIDTWVGGTGGNFSTATNWSYSSGSGPVASGDSLVFASGGSLTPTNDEINFIFGGITFGNGGSAYTLGGNAFILGSGASISLLGTAAQVINNDIALSGSGGTINLSAAGANLSLNGHISGTTNFNVTGSTTGTLSLSGNNTFSGTLALNAGTVVFTTPPSISGGNLGNPSGVTFGGSSTSTLQTSSGAGAVTISGPTITVNTNSSCQFRNGSSGTNAFQLAAKITGPGNCKQSTPVTADNVVKFSNDSNDYTGNFQMQGGVVEFTTVTNGGVAAALGGKGTNVYAIANGTTAATLRYVGTANSSTTRSMDWEGTTGRLILEGSGSGTVQFLSSATLKSGSGASSLTLTGTNLGANTLAQVINDSGGVTSVTKSGTGTWVLSGTNTYSGVTTVSGGTLIVNGQVGAGGVNATNGTLGGSGTILGPVTLGSNATLAPGTAAIGTLTVHSNLSIGGDLIFNVQTSASPSNDMVVVTGSLTNTGSGTLTLSNLGSPLTASNRFVLFSKPLSNGLALTVTGAGVNWTNLLAVDGSIAVLPPPVTNIDTWIGGTGSNFSTAANWSYSPGPGPVASGDSLVFNSGGALTPNNDEVNFSFTNITFNAAGSAYTLGGNPFTLGSGGSISVLGAAPQAINNDITLTGNGGTANVNAAGANLTLGGRLSGNANFTMTGNTAGTLTLTGSNTFSGIFMLNAGTVVFTTPPGASGGNLGNPSGFTFNGSSTSTLQTSSNAGAVTISGPALTVTTNSSCQFRNGSTNVNSFEITAKITGAGNCKQSTPVIPDNIVKFSNDTNDYTGNFQMQGGVVEFTTVANGGLAAALGGKGTNAYAIANGTTAATLRYVGASNSSTARTLNWQGNTGGLILDASGSGTVQFLGGVNLRSGLGAASLTLTGTNAGANTLAQVLNDSGGATTVTKSGSGTWVLSGPNTYTGTTGVSGGTLLANGQIGVGGLNVTNGTLGGSGTISSAVSLAAGGTLAPGTATIGSLTINSSLSIGGNLLFKVQTSSSPSNDMVVVTGSLTNAGSGTLTVSNLGPALTGGNRFVLFSKPVSNGAALSVTGAGANWTNMLAVDGSVAVLPVTSTSRTNVTVSFDGTNVTVRWPADHTGWHLQAQTNSITAGLGTNWVTIPGSDTTNLFRAPINRTNGAVFYRLVYP
jgi:autotransporter-associated beta strand protein